MSKYYDNIDRNLTNFRKEELLESIRAFRNNKPKICIYGKVMTIDDASKNYPDEYKKYRKWKRRSERIIDTHDSFQKLIRNWEQNNLIDRLGLHEASSLERKKLHVKSGDIVGELGEGDIKILLRSNGLFKSSVDDYIKKCKWIMSIDSKRNIDGEKMFEGLFDPTYDFSKSKFTQGCYRSYSENKSQFTVGFQDDLKLQIFMHILKIIVQQEKEKEKENGANTFKQRIQCNTAEVNPSDDRTDTAGIQVPETLNDGWYFE